jgi:hypothetical protein
MPTSSRFRAHIVLHSTNIQQAQYSALYVSDSWVPVHASQDQHEQALLNEDQELWRLEQQMAEAQEAEALDLLEQEQGDEQGWSPPSLGQN